MLEYNEVKPRKYIVLEGEPYEVLSYHVFRKQQRKPVNATKLRHLITGKVMEYSFHVSDKVEEAEIRTRQVKYLYTSRGEYWFCEANDPSKRFQLEAEQIGEQAKYLLPNMLVDLASYEDRLVGVKLPIKMTFAVTEAPPSIKGNTAQGGTKVVTLETGATIDAPLFVNQGDKIVVNTETGEYVERA